MAVIVETDRNPHTDQAMPQNSAQNNDYQDGSGTVPRWVENNPSYLSHLQALLAGLTEEDKDAIHASLEEE